MNYLKIVVHGIFATAQATHFGKPCLKPTDSGEFERQTCPSSLRLCHTPLRTHMCVIPAVYYILSGISQITIRSAGHTSFLLQSHLQQDVPAAQIIWGHPFQARFSFIMAPRNTYYCVGRRLWQPSFSHLYNGGCVKPIFPNLSHRQYPRACLRLFIRLPLGLDLLDTVSLNAAAVDAFSPYRLLCGLGDISYSAGCLSCLSRITLGCNGVILLLKSLIPNACTLAS